MFYYIHFLLSLYFLFMNKVNVPLSVKGKYASHLSISPLKEGAFLGKQLVTYLEELRDKHNASVFRIHAGLKTVVCLDYVSAEFYFNAPRDILEREATPRFGPIAVRPELLKGACPALVSAGKLHDNSRDLTNAILEKRAKDLPLVFEKVSQRLFTKWSKMESVSLYDALLEWSSNIACNWILGMDISLEKAKLWTDNIITLNTDTLLSQLLGKLMLPKCPRQAIQMNEEMTTLIKKSPLFVEYEKMAIERQVDTKTLTNFLTFLCLFNGTGAPTFSLFYAIAKIYSLDDLKQDLYQELEGLDEAAILNNKFLDHVFYEVMRLNTRPRIFYKRAQKDFEMPAANGLSYQIKKGELVLIPAPIAHQDPNVFDNPTAFLPTRYDNNPTLKEKIFGFGTLNTNKTPYGCAAAPTGQATWIWKKMLSKWITKVNFDFNIEPTFDFDAFFNFRPRNIKLLNFTYGQTPSSKKVSNNNRNTSTVFSEVSNKVRTGKVKFKKKQYLKLYGLYKQALNGNNKKPMPAAIKVLDRQKWMAWKTMKDISTQKAMETYIELVEEVENPQKMLATSLVSSEPIATTTKDLNASSSSSLAASPLLNTKTIQILDTEPNTNLLVKTKFTLKGHYPDFESDIKLSLHVIGENGAADPLNILILNNDVERQSEVFEETWSFPLKNIGKPQVIYASFSLTDEQMISSWYIESINLQLEEVGLTFDFSYYSTVNIPTKNVILFEAKGCLPQYENEIQQTARETYIHQCKQIFQWEKTSDALPACLKIEDYGDLPLEEQFEEKLDAAPLPNTEDNEIEALPAKNYDYYLQKTTSNNRSTPRLAKDNLWQNDEEFGRLYLQGTHCNFIHQCTSLPSNLNINSSFEVPKATKTLASLIEEGLLYMADYELLLDAKPPEGRYLCAPIVLLYSEVKTQKLWPIAIQLQRHQQAPVFTPADTATDWLLAKMWVRTADITMHQLASHFLYTHAVSENFAIAAYRTFASNHPIYQLLKPHFKYTLGISLLARMSLLNDGGWIDSFGSFGGNVRHQVMEKAYKNSALKTSMNLFRDLNSRGVDDSRTLPSYPYRDDALLIWDAILVYVRASVAAFYKNDKMVKEDFLLSQWLKEFQEKGYEYNDWGQHITSVEGLVDLLTSIIFNATAQHGSMNFLQYEVYGFVPNSPVAMHSPPPSHKGISTTKDILAALPGNQTADIFLFLSQEFDEDIKLGNHQTIFSSHIDSRYALLQFRKKLEEIEQIIQERNKERAVPYTVLLPSKIPNSIDL